MNFECSRYKNNIQEQIERKQGKRVVFDIETNGKLRDVSKFHCAVAVDIDDKSVCKFYPDQLNEFIDFINDVDLAVAHNSINYDNPVLEKLSGRFINANTHYDTLVASRLYHSNLIDIDGPFIRRKRLPVKLRGSHSLKAWGYRLNVLKGEFSENTDWQEFSNEMLEYCYQDCLVTLALFNTLQNQHDLYLNLEGIS